MHNPQADIMLQKVNIPKKWGNHSIKTCRIKTISEVHRNETEIDSKIDLVNNGSENEIKVAAMLQLQRQSQSNNISIPH